MAAKSSSKGKAQTVMPKDTRAQTVKPKEKAKPKFQTPIRKLEDQAMLKSPEQAKMLYDKANEMISLFEENVKGYSKSAGYKRWKDVKSKLESEYPDLTKSKSKGKKK